MDSRQRKFTPPLPRIYRQEVFFPDHFKSKKQYKTRLKEWNLGKKISGEEKAAISRIRKRRLEGQPGRVTRPVKVTKRVKGAVINCLP